MTAWLCCAPPSGILSRGTPVPSPTEMPDVAARNAASEHNHRSSSSRRGAGSQRNFERQFGEPEEHPYTPISDNIRRILSAKLAAGILSEHSISYSLESNSV